MTHLLLMFRCKTPEFMAFRRATRACALGLIINVVLVSFAAAQIGGKAGAYSRMGFGARGLGMGNALTAVTTGDAVGYYNPATLPYAAYRNISASFGILSLDRRLNFLSFVQPLGGGNDTAANRARAGLAAGIINSGVTNIDGRDSDGEPTGLLQTAENQAFLSFGTSLRNKLALGVTIKYLYHHLYTNVNSSTFGFDLGVLYRVSDRLTLGATARDFSSKYSWDTKGVYGEQRAATTTDKFPRLYTIGAAYGLPDTLGVAAVDVELSDQSTISLKAGVEVSILPEVTVRAGMDRIDLKEKGTGVRPAFGFSAKKNFDAWTPALNYAFVVEPFTSSGMHMISISVIF